MENGLRGFPPRPRAPGGKAEGGREGEDSAPDGAPGCLGHARPRHQTPPETGRRQEPPCSGDRAGAAGLPGMGKRARLWSLRPPQRIPEAAWLRGPRRASRDGPSEPATRSRETPEAGAPASGSAHAPCSTRVGPTDLGLPEHVPPAGGAAGRLALLQHGRAVHGHGALGVAGLTAGHGRVLQGPMLENRGLLAERGLCEVHLPGGHHFPAGNGLF